MKREPMLGNESFQKKIMEKIGLILSEYADQEIERLCNEFQERLKKKKAVVLGRLIQAIDIFTEYDMPNDRYIIQVTIRNDKVKP